MKRKLVTLLLALACIFGLAGLTACDKEEDTALSSSQTHSSSQMQNNETDNDNGEQEEEETVVVPPTEGLDYRLSTDKSYYIVTGLGKAESVNDLVIPATYKNLDVKEISNSAFKECTGLKSVIIPENVEIIGEDAFNECTNLTTITLPKSIKAIGKYAFTSCSNLMGVYIKDIAAWCSIDFDYYYANPLYWSEKLYVNNVLVEELVVPDSVSEIKGYAFYSYDLLTNVTVGRNVRTIGEGAFGSCAFQALDLSSATSLKTIEFGAFSGCENLTAAILPEGLEKIESGVFDNCYFLKTLNLPDSLKYVDCDFNDCDLEYTEYNGGRYLGNSTNEYVYLASVDNELREFTPHQNCKIFGKGCFYDCNKLTKISSPNGLRHINAQFPTHLSALTIPKSILTIGEAVFSGCQELLEVNYLGTLEQWAVIDFHENGGNPLHSSTLREGTNEVERGRKLLIDGTELTEATFSSGEIKAEAFKDCPSLQTVIIENGVTIGERAFEGCVNLTTLSVDSQVITNYAFLGCTSLNVLTMGDSVEEIQKYAFSGCAVLSNIVIGDNVRIIGDCAFYDIQAPKYVTIGYSVEYIGVGAFSHSEFQHSNYGKVQSLTFTNTEGWHHVNNERDAVDKVGGFELDVSNAQDNAAYYYGTDFQGYYYNSCHFTMQYLAPTSCLDGYIKYVCEGENCSIDNHQYTFVLKSEGHTLVNHFCTKCGEGVCSEGVELVLNADEKSYSVVYMADEDTFISEKHNGLPITGILREAWEGNGGSSIYISKNVTTIEYNSWVYGNNLRSIIIDENNPVYESKGNCIIEKATKTLILGCNNSVIPTDGSVLSIGSYAFFRCWELSSITIPDSIQTIGTDAFAGCAIMTAIMPTRFIGNIPQSNLQEVVLTSGVSISKGAFENCTTLTGITLGNSVQTIGEYTFKGCTELTSVTIGDSVQTIGSYAFSNCTKLASVSIPDSVQSIGAGAFSGCSGLTEIVLPFVGGSRKTSSDTYQYPFGYIFGMSSYEGSTETTQYYYGSSTSATTYSTYYIPTSLTKVTITGGNILSYAFDNCDNLMSVNIPDSVETIGDDAFASCINLTSVTIPDSVQTIGFSAFYHCTNLTSVTIPNSVQTIGEYAFKGCTELTSVTIGDSVQTIGNGAFFGCDNLMSVNIPNSVQTIGSSAFYNCDNLMSVNIPNSVQTIGSSAFYNCDNLMSVNIPNSVQTIGSDAFYNCDNLMSVNIPNSVQTIGSSAFHNCDKLTSITVAEDNAYYASIDGNLYNKDKTTLIQYAIGKTATSFTIPDSVQTIGNYAFSGCTNLTSVSIPDSVETIGNYAFYYCTKLTSVSIPDSVQTIGNYAFSGCSNLTDVYITDIAAWCAIDFGDGSGNPLYFAKNLYVNNVLVTDLVIPDGITEIKKYAFYNLDNLTSVTIGDGVQTIERDAFYFCNNLTSVTIGRGIRKIGDGAFGNCNNLTSITVSEDNAYYASQDGILYNKAKTKFVHIPNKISGAITIPDGIQTIGYAAFWNCTNLTSVIIPDSVQTIESSAFDNCDNLTSVVIGDGVQSIERFAFEYCDNLTTVYYNGTAEEWNAISIGSYNSDLTSATRYYYSETSKAGYWHYDTDGVTPVIW